MNLTKTLKEQGYDLIGGPVRNHKLLQLWLKEPSEEAQFQYSHISHAFVSAEPLEELESAALSVNSNVKDEYGFNIGITVLDGILKAIGLGTLELSSKLKSGKNVTISYDNAVTRECANGDIVNYLSSADFKHANPILLKQANKNQILVVTGVILAKNLIIDIETDFALSAELLASLKDEASGKFDFSLGNKTKLKMISSGDQAMPIAVKAYRLDYDKNIFSGLSLITDNRNIF